MEIWCSFCGDTTSVELDESHESIWTRCRSCEMNMGRLTGLGPDEKAHFIEVISDYKVALEHRLSSGVVIRPYTYSCDSDLLDISVLLFGHVILFLEGLDFEKDRRLGSRILTYRDAAVLTPVWLTTNRDVGAHSKADAYRPFFKIPSSIETHAVDLTSAMRRTRPNSFFTPSEMLEELAWYDQHQTMLSKTMAEVAMISEQSLGTEYNSWVDRQVMGLQKFQLISAVLGGQPLLRGGIGDLARSLASDQQGEAVVRDIATRGELAEWYRRRTSMLPRFESARTVLQMRDAVGGESLKETVDRILSDPAPISFAELVTETERQLDRILVHSRRVEGRGVTFASIGSGAVTGTVGGLIGGPFGAVLGGVGGAAAPLLIEMMRGRRTTWTSYLA